MSEDTEFQLPEVLRDADPEDIDFRYDLLKEGDEQ